MGQTIYKYNLLPGQNRLKLPMSCRILTAQMQNEKITVWVQLDPEEEEQAEVDFFVVGTGQSSTDALQSATYINTVQDSQDLVWHVFWDV